MSPSPATRWEELLTPELRDEEAPAISMRMRIDEDTAWRLVGFTLAAAVTLYLWYTTQ